MTLPSSPTDCLTVVADSASELRSKITTGTITMSRWTLETGIYLTFTDQGSAYPEVAISLLKVNLFAQTMEQADVVFRRLGAEWSILDKCSLRRTQPSEIQPS